MKLHLSLLLVLSLSIVFCSRPSDDDQHTDFAVSNSWECSVNGVMYSGSIDSSFAEYSGAGSFRDTMLYCTGTSSDKKANIHFALFINRRARNSDSLVTQAGMNEFNFDTSSSARLRAWANLGGITFHIEKFNGKKISGRFSGTAFGINGGGNKTVSNGKFSFELGKGNAEPKFLYCNTNNTNIRGYVSEASLISNTLIINGLGFHADSTFQLMIRTGGEIKAGVYKSQDGNVGFQAYRPSIVTNYVSDAIGDLTVTIQSVTGNIVEGIFSGSSQGASTGSQVSITNGTFKCRVKNYQPQIDSINKWGFSESNELEYPYQTWGGNILNANKYQTGGLYYLIINGESDNGSSKFKIKLRSSLPIAPGIYETGSNYPNNADSVYFYSSPLNLIYTQPYSSQLACQIDTIDNQKVVGRFYGKIQTIWDPNSGFSSTKALRRGFFKAQF